MNGRDYITPLEVSISSCTVIFSSSLRFRVGVPFSGGMSAESGVLTWQLNVANVASDDAPAWAARGTPAWSSWWPERGRKPWDISIWCSKRSWRGSFWRVLDQTGSMVDIETAKTKNREYEEARKAPLSLYSQASKPLSLWKAIYTW